MRTRGPAVASKALGAEDPAAVGVPTGLAARPVALVLARVHLRLGSLALARAELEVLDQAGELDLPGRIDLAEVRWRTGDLAGAVEAASTALSAGEEDAIALTIAAEAAAADGRPNEARRLATRALERGSVPLEELFGGMPRSSVWPADPADPPPTAGTLFHHDVPAIQTLRAGDTDPAVAAARASSSRDADLGQASGALGLWDSDEASRPSTSLPDAAGALDAARVAIASGAIDEGLVDLGLVLRLAPALAPSVLEVVEGLAGPAANLVRGDAFRLVGLEEEARRAFAAAAWSGDRDRRGRSTTGATDPQPAEADSAADRAAKEPDPDADAPATPGAAD